MKPSHVVMLLGIAVSAAGLYGLIGAWALVGAGVAIILLALFSDMEP